MSNTSGSVFGSFWKCKRIRWERIKQWVRLWGAQASTLGEFWWCSFRTWIREEKPAQRTDQLLLLMCVWSKAVFGWRQRGHKARRWDATAAEELQRGGTITRLVWDFFVRKKNNHKKKVKTHKRVWPKLPVFEIFRELLKSLEQKMTPFTPGADETWTWRKTWSQTWE